MRKPLLFVCALLLSVSAFAQTADEIIAKHITAMGGMDKLKAVQFCHRHKAPKGLGVTLFVRSVSADGTHADLGVAVDCWGDSACTGENCSQRTFKGSLTVDGDAATLVFRDNLHPERGLHEPIRGHVETREGKPAIVFGKSVMQFTDGPAETRELIFQ